MTNPDLSRARWRKSTRTGGGNCIEVAAFSPDIAIRDSKDAHGPVLLTDPASWSGLAAAIKTGGL